MRRMKIVTSKALFIGLFSAILSYRGGEIVLAIENETRMDFVREVYWYEL